MECRNYTLMLIDIAWAKLFLFIQIQKLKKRQTPFQSQFGTQVMVSKLLPWKTSDNFLAFQILQGPTKGYVENSEQK